MKFMTYGQAAEFLEIKLGTLYALVHHRRIPHVRLGARLVRFQREELEEWIAQRSVSPTGV